MVALGRKHRMKCDQNKIVTTPATILYNQQHCSWVGHENECTNPTTPPPTTETQQRSSGASDLNLLNTTKHNVTNNSTIRATATTFTTRITTTTTKTTKTTLTTTLTTTSTTTLTTSHL